MSHWWTPSNWLFALTPGEYHKSTFHKGGREGGQYYCPRIYILLYPWNLKFRGYHSFGPVSRNCDTNAHIKFIFDTTIDDLEWKNPIDFGENRKTKGATNFFLIIWWKSLCTWSKMHRSTSYLMQPLTYYRGRSYQYWSWSEKARYAIKSDFQASKMASRLDSSAV